MNSTWSSLVKMWTVVAVLTQTATANHLSGRSQMTTADAAADTTADGEMRGSCWLTTSGGRCSGLYALNVTETECCALRPGSKSISYATGWTPFINMTSRQYFYWIVVGQGVPGCRACRSTCEGFECGGGGGGGNKVCRMRHGQPRCVCAADCAALLVGTDLVAGWSGVDVHRRGATVPADSWPGPVCGFDGRTHRNLCAMARYNCRSGLNIPVEYIGSCQSSCENVTCPGGKHCAQDQNGVPHCVRCRTHCPSSSSSDVVCGGDGNTYSSLCTLERDTCLAGRPIRLAYTGNCQSGLTCRGLQCSAGERCLMNTDSQTPVCFPCHRPCYAVYGSGRRALCGSDHRTYESHCALERAACRRGVVIYAIHAGRCADGEAVDDAKLDDN